MKLDIVAFGSHPDDVEISCGGSIAKSVAQGKRVGIIDLTQGELSTRGNVEQRNKEAKKAASILKVVVRENLGLRDGFFLNDEKNQRSVIKTIRSYTPEIVLCNAASDRHIDHAKGGNLVCDACFLSGLEKVAAYDDEGKHLSAWRPKLILRYIQWDELKPDIIMDISDFLETKVSAVKAYKSQLYDPKSGKRETPISTKNFLESISYRSKNLGRLIGKEAAEGFTASTCLHIDAFDSLIS